MLRRGMALFKLDHKRGNNMKIPPKDRLPKVRHYLGYFYGKKSQVWLCKLECVKLVLEKCYSCNYVSVEKGDQTFANGLGFISIMEPLVCCRKNQSYSVALNWTY
jgi:hypothetical protein